jgi:hypothetical protein
VIARWLALRILRGAAWLAVRLLAVLVTAGVLVAAAPVTLAAAAAAWTAWMRGWPPGRLYREAAWQLPMVVTWLAATAVAARAWPAVALAPVRVWTAMWHLAAAGELARALVVSAPAAIPLGILAGGAVWSYRVRSMAAAAAGTSPGSAISFDQRQWRHQARGAAARIAAPGAVPLTTGAGDVVVGAVIRAVGHPAGRLARLRYERLRSHQVVIGGTGTGKTTLLLRLWAAFMATALRRHAAGHGPAPLLVVLDCKGGRDARKIADRARRVLRAAGARSTAVWPDEASLSLWSLPPDQLITTLADLVEHGTGGAAYYADVLDAVVALAVSAPGGPPASSADFLGRLDPGWLTLAYQSRGNAAELELIRSAGRQIPDVALRYRTLFRRLGRGLDGPGALADADAWYCILEGTAETSVAEAQARALIDLLASYITSGQPAREVLLAVDEFSAVSRRLPIWSLYERARSLGLAVQVSAQSWHGLAPDDTARYRIVSAAEGGIWLLRTPHPEPVTELAGERRALDTTRRLVRFPRWGREGHSRVREVPVVDPALVRGLDVGQAAYLYRGGVTFVQVSRLVTGPASLPAARGLDIRTAGAFAAADGEWSRAGVRRLAGVTALLDAAYGAEPGGGAGLSGVGQDGGGQGGGQGGAGSGGDGQAGDGQGRPGPAHNELAQDGPARREARTGGAGGGPGWLATGSARGAVAGGLGVAGAGTGGAAGVAGGLDTGLGTSVNSGLGAGAGGAFGVLGLRASAGLSDDDVRAAWRRVAAATHPDRADGGDPAAFAVAAAAYSDLRTRFGRGEALADLGAGHGLTASDGAGHGAAGRPAASLAGARAGLRRLGRRAGRGRPGRLAGRAGVAVVVCGLVVGVDGMRPASAALIVGAATWLARSSRYD